MEVAASSVAVDACWVEVPAPSALVDGCWAFGWVLFGGVFFLPPTAVVSDLAGAACMSQHCHSSSIQSRRQDTTALAPRSPVVLVVVVAVVGAAAAAVVVAVVDPLVLRRVLREDFRLELLNSCRLWVSLVS